MFWRNPAYTISRRGSNKKLQQMLIHTTKQSWLCSQPMQYVKNDPLCFTQLKSTQQFHICLSLVSFFKYFFLSCTTDSGIKFKLPHVSQTQVSKPQNINRHYFKIRVQYLPSREFIKIWSIEKQVYIQQVSDKTLLQTRHLGTSVYVYAGYKRRFLWRRWFFLENRNNQSSILQNISEFLYFALYTNWNQWNYFTLGLLFSFIEITQQVFIISILLLKHDKLCISKIKSLQLTIISVLLNKRTWIIKRPCNFPHKFCI